VGQHQQLAKIVEDDAELRHALENCPFPHQQPRLRTQSPAMSASHMRRHCLARFANARATQVIEDAALCFRPRRPATTTQSFQLPFKLLQLCDPRANVRNVLIKQPMRRFAIFLRQILHTQQLSDSAIRVSDVRTPRARSRAHRAVTGLS
jgi:hypothetical protein